MNVGVVETVGVTQEAAALQGEEVLREARLAVAVGVGRSAAAGKIGAEAGSIC